MKKYIVLSLSALSMLFVGCSSAPSDSTVKSCILNANGMEELNVEYDLGMMTMTINDISIDNTFEHDDYYEVHVTTEATAGPLGKECKKMDDKETEQMITFMENIGKRWDPETCSTTYAETSVYSFTEGSKGWGCSAI